MRMSMLRARPPAQTATLNTGCIMVLNNEKMSKSTKNLVTIRDSTKDYHPLALRYFLVSTHYRSPTNYSTSQLEIASVTVFYIYQTLCGFEPIYIWRKKCQVQMKSLLRNKNALISCALISRQRCQMICILRIS